MAKEAKNIITTICDEQCNLSDRVKTFFFNFFVFKSSFSLSFLQLLPKHCAPLIAQVVNKKKRDKFRKPEVDKPGTESYRKTREDLTTSVFSRIISISIVFFFSICLFKKDG